MSGYVKGRRFEYRVRDFLRKNGFVVIRAAQSKPIDLYGKKLKVGNGGRDDFRRMQDGEVWAREDKKAGASESSGGSWRCAAAEHPKETKADFQRSENQQDSSDRPNPLTKLSSQCP